MLGARSIVACVALAMLACVKSPPSGRPPTAVTHPASTGATTEVSQLGGASYRIDIPATWNGELVMYCHGYSASPIRFERDAPDLPAQAFAGAGYAIAQSGYAMGGYAVIDAVRDTEALRHYFASQYGAPRATWVSGVSLGGSVTIMLMEMFPNTYDGGLPMCAPLGPAVSYIKTLLFDLLVLFEYSFPDVLPSPAHVPPDYVMTLERPDTLTKVLEGKPEAAAALRRRTTARTNKELALHLDLFTYILGELQRRWGGNAFDNRDTVYTGFGDDEAVNDGVKRYRADSRALALAVKYYTPTGLITRPVLSVRTVYDPLISAFSSDRYEEILQIAGREELFAQKYVKGSGHCEIRPEEMRAALAELRQWKLTGARPAPGALRADKSDGSSEVIP